MTKTVLTLRIRRGQAEDWKSIFQIQQGLQFVSFTGYCSPPMKQDVRERWEKRLSESLAHTLVAETEDGGKVVGYVRLRQGEGKGSHVGEISIVAVHAEWQRRGIGTQLVKAVLGVAESLALKRVRLTVHADNRAAIRLYEKFGFEIEGRERQATYKDGNYTDIL